MSPVSSLGSRQAAVDGRLRQMDEERLVDRIWAKDPTVWKPDPRTPEITNRLGWLNVADTMLAGAADLQAFAEDARRRGRLDHVVLCGMGGSSLAPEVLRRTFGSRRGFPRLTVLDTTAPDAIAAVGAERAGLARTLFVVSSKSGTTQETASLAAHFWEVTEAAGAQFVAVTDPRTPLERLARERGFRRVFVNPPDIGGGPPGPFLFCALPGGVFWGGAARRAAATRRAVASRLTA